MEKIPHFGMVEVVFGTLVSILIDVIALLLTPETLDIGNALLHWLVWFIFVFWFHFKGVKGEVNFGKILKRMGVQIIPLTYTISFLFVAWQTNNPKTGAIAETALKLSGAVKSEDSLKLAGTTKKATGIIGKMAKAA